MKLVTLENDPGDTWSLTHALRDAGYHCRGYRTVDALIGSPWVQEADLAIIDADGSNIGRRLVACLAEEFWPDRPMLFVCNPDYPFDEVARRQDECLVKPVSTRNLVARVRTTLSRTWDHAPNPEAMRFGRYLFEPDGHGVMVGNTRVALTHKEYQLALLLFRHLSKPVSRVYIAGCVWRHDERINARTMTAHFSAIRSKLQLRPDADYALTPIYNYGYRLDPVVRPRVTAPAADTLHA